VKDITELINFLTSKSNVLVTIVLVALVVLLVFVYGLLNIEAPYVYGVYLVLLAGLTAAMFLLVGAVMFGGGWTRKKLEAKWKDGTEDERALGNLDTIDIEHAEYLYWIVKKEGERFPSLRWRELDELVDHGFLIYDDRATRHNEKTYFRVRKVIWGKVSAQNYEWGWRFGLGSKPPWVARHRV